MTKMGLCEFSMIGINTVFNMGESQTDTMSHCRHTNLVYQQSQCRDRSHDCKKKSNCSDDLHLSAKLKKNVLVMSHNRLQRHNAYCA